MAANPAILRGATERNPSVVVPCSTSITIIANNTTGAAARLVVSVPDPRIILLELPSSLRARPAKSARTRPHRLASTRIQCESIYRSIVLEMSVNASLLQKRTSVSFFLALIVPRGFGSRRSIASSRNHRIVIARAMPLGVTSPGDGRAGLRLPQRSCARFALWCNGDVVPFVVSVPLCCMPSDPLHSSTKPARPSSSKQAYRIHRAPVLLSRDRRSHNVFKYLRHRTIVCVGHWRAPIDRCSIPGGSNSDDENNSKLQA